MSFPGEEHVGGHTAEEIHHRLTEVSRQAVETGNFELFLSCFHLPHQVSTFEGTTVLETPEDLRAVFDGLRRQLKELRVTRYERICTFAKFLSPTRISATHESYLYRDQDLVAEPSIALSIIEFRDGRWRVSSGQYATDRDHVLARLTSSGKDTR